MVEKHRMVPEHGGPGMRQGNRWSGESGSGVKPAGQTHPRIPAGGQDDVSSNNLP